MHYGMYKTGSSSIQQSLADLRTDVPWEYLNAGKPNASVALATMFKARPEAVPQIAKRGIDRDQAMRDKQLYFSRLEKQITATQKDLLLSGEGIASMKEEEFRSMVDWLKQYVDEIVAVGYVRSPKAYMESSFQQKVKGGQGGWDPVRTYPKYRKHFEKLETVLGKDKVQYWLFDPKSYVDGCVVRDFARRLGGSLTADEVKRSNEGISREALSLLYAYRKYGDGYGVGNEAVKQNQLLIKKLATLGGHKIRFSPKLVRPILDENKADIAWMEERLGKPFEEDMVTSLETDIEDEGDLLKFNEASIITLRQWIGQPSGGMVNSPQEAAHLVLQLREKLAYDNVGFGGKLCMMIKKYLQ